MSTLQQKATKILKLFEANNPNPQTELVYTTPLTLAISVILSAQSTDNAVNKVMKELGPQIDVPEKIVAMGIEQLQLQLKNLNYYRNKAKYIMELAKILIEKYHSHLPLDFDSLLQLPGIGRKTAHVILNVLTNANGIAVDTHVMRVARRLGLSSEKTPEKIEQDLYDCIPKRFWSRVNHWLVLHGRYVCKAKKPNCSTCFLMEYCPYHQEIHKKLCPK